MSPTSFISSPVIPKHTSLEVAPFEWVLMEPAGRTVNVNPLGAVRQGSVKAARRRYKDRTWPRDTSLSSSTESQYERLVVGASHSSAWSVRDRITSGWRRYLNSDQIESEKERWATVECLEARFVVVRRTRFLEDGYLIR